MVKRMDKKKRIDSIFNILFQFEQIFEKDSNVTEESYRGYLDRLYIWYLGYGNNDIATYIKGLYNLGASAEHETVRRGVFHIIKLLEAEVSSQDGI